MGRQINFFLHTDDQDDFDKLLKSFGEVTFLPYYHYNNVVSTVDTTIITDFKKEGSRIYLVRPDDLETIKLHKIENFYYWLVDDLKIPVLHFDRSFMRDNILLSGRLYYNVDYWEESGLIKKPEEFVYWADKFLKATRRKLKRYPIVSNGYEYKMYLGEKAVEWVKQHLPNVYAGGHELRSTINA